jgi:uncharacterized membrane protein
MTVGSGSAAAAGDGATPGAVRGLNRIRAMVGPAAAEAAAEAAGGTLSHASPTASGTRLTHPPVDLAVLVLFAVVALASVLLPAPVWVRFPFGLALVLFLPGYAIVSALFPARAGLDGVDRIGLGFALSLAVLPPVALVLDRTPAGLALTPTIAALAGVTLIGAVAGLARRVQRAPDDRFVASVRRPAISAPTTWDWRARGFAALFGLALILMVAGGFPIVAAHLQGDRLTEFALYTGEGDPAHFQRRLVAGQPFDLRLGIANHEGRAVAYELAVAGAGAAFVEAPPRVVLADGEAWEETVRVVARDVGEDQPIVFALGREGQAEPYRTLQLIVDVAADDG